MWGETLRDEGANIATLSPGRFSLALYEVGPTSKAREKRYGDEVANIDFLMALNV